MCKGSEALEQRSSLVLHPTPAAIRGPEFVHHTREVVSRFGAARLQPRYQQCERIREHLRREIALAREARLVVDEEQTVGDGQSEDGERHNGDGDGHHDHPAFTS